MRVLKRVKRFSLIGDLIHLIFPNQCLICENEVSKSELHLCAFCDQNLPLTNFHLMEEATDMDKLFWGRIAIHKTYCYLFFEKNKASQDVLFNLKYKNNFDLGVYFGQRMGDKLANMSAFDSVDAYIPVPLHPKKKFIRGYNQSEAIAKGICEKLNHKLDLKTVRRTKHSETQTKKSRFQRWDNVNEIFYVRDAILNYNHIVLVDDVITTGSTLEAISAALLKKNPNLLISVVTLAIA